MQPQTVNLLNQLNSLFYQTTANSFDATRQRPWPGWEVLLPLLVAGPAPLHVLDVGCGNGRFGVFLQQRLPQALHYVGVDSSPALLERAAQHLQGSPPAQVMLLQADLLADWQAPARYDCIALFGLLHHIPGFDNRQRMIQQLFAALHPGGLLAMSFWRFVEQPRLRAKIVPWDDPRVPPPYRDLPLERGDYLLDWRRETPALRYCHYADDAEIAALLAGLPLLQQYDADGSNRYVLLRRAL